MSCKARAAISLSAVLYLASCAGLCGTAAAQGAGMQAPASVLVVTPGQTDDGKPTAQWLDMIRVFHDAAGLVEIAASRSPLTAEQGAWRVLIERRAREWPAATAALAVPFEGITPPPAVHIVLGNRGGSDAFAPGTGTMGFDLGRLHAVYGPADRPGNAARLDRFFAHEYTHLMHKAWRGQRAPRIESPIDRALWECLAEGLGNYYSLTPKWRDGEGRPSAHALAVLARLEPEFARRLGALAEADDDEAEELMQGLSMGPFEQKWGALTVALWLAEETRGDPSRLGEWVERGPRGVLELAGRHLPAELVAMLPPAGR